jgi:hypothetical protein
VQAFERDPHACGIMLGESHAAKHADSDVVLLIKIVDAEPLLAELLLVLPAWCVALASEK